MTIVAARGLCSGMWTSGARKYRRGAARSERRQDDRAPAGFRRERPGLLSSAWQPDHRLRHEEPVSRLQPFPCHCSGTGHAAVARVQESPKATTLSASARRQCDRRDGSPLGPAIRGRDVYALSFMATRYLVGGCGLDRGAAELVAVGYNARLDPNTVPDRHMSVSDGKTLESTVRSESEPHRRVVRTGVQSGVG